MQLSLIFEFPRDAIRGRETPGPIPNPVVKPSPADGTLLARAGESRWSRGFFIFAFLFQKFLEIILCYNNLVMFVEYIEEALKRARYEIIEDDEPFYGEIPELDGVWATGKTLEECRENLREVLEGWILIRLRKNLDIPPLGDKKN